MPFKKGQSGNPGGKAKTKDFSEAIRLSVLEAEGDKTKLRLIAEKLVEMAVQGDMQAIREVGDRLEGKPSQSVDVNDAREPIPEQEERDRILELLERRGTIRAAEEPGNGANQPGKGQPKGIRPVH